MLDSSLEKVGDLPLAELQKRLAEKSFALGIGSFDVAVDSRLRQVAPSMLEQYGDYPLLEVSSAHDFHISLQAPSYFRNVFRPQVNFSFDGYIPFKPLPQDQAFAMFEWGLNWCIANSAHQFLNIHAAVVAYEDRALILPGSPGSGKSTLCAALVGRGWRLLSDEMALVSLADGMVVPVPRPVSLKNESIDIIRRYVPDCVIGEEVRDTAKGTVAHMKPPTQSVIECERRATPAFIVFPKYKAGAETVLSPASKGKALMELGGNSFNYHVLGESGFHQLAEIVEQCGTYNFEYQSLNEAVELMTGLLKSGGRIDE